MSMMRLTLSAGTLSKATLKPTIPSVAWPSEKPGDEARFSFREQKALMNSSKRRNETPRLNQQSRATAVDEFDDAGLDDSDLMAAAAGDDDLGFQHIDDDNDYHIGMPAAAREITAKLSGRSSNQPKAQTATEDDWQPKRLANGNWECNHACKDKNGCKHLCCRDGLDKPPKAPKRSAAGDQNQREARAATQPEAKPQKVQTTLDMETIQTRMGPPVSIAEVPRMDLTKETTEKQGILRDPSDLKHLPKLHSATQTKDAPLVSRAFPVATPSTMATGSEPCLSFLPKRYEGGLSSDYGEESSDSDLPNISFVSTMRDEETSNNIPRMTDHHAGVPEESRAFEFGDSDSLLDEAMVGLIDSQSLQATQGDDRMEGYGTDWSTDMVNVGNNSISAVAQPETPHLDSRKHENKLLPSHIDLQAPTAPKKRDSTAVPFVETNSSSPFFGQKANFKTKAKRANLEKGMERESKRRNTKTAASTHEEMMTARQSGDADILANSRSGPVSDATEEIDPWILQEFGQYVDFI